MNALAAITQGRLAMPRGSVLRVQDGEGITLHVWSGSLWITQEGDRQDYYVRAGHAFSLDRGGLALVSATRRALVTMTTPARQDPGVLRNRLFVNPVNHILRRTTWK